MFRTAIEKLQKIRTFNSILLRRCLSNLTIDEDVKKTNLKDQFVKQTNSEELNRKKNKSILVKPAIKFNLVEKLNESTNFEKEEDDMLASNKLNQSYSINQNEDPLINKLNELTDILSILDLIKPEVYNLRPDHLEFFYDKINTLAVYARNRSNLSSFGKYKEFYQIIQTSPVFKSILNQTYNSFEELNNNTLIYLLKTFNFINQDPETKIVKLLFRKLEYRLETLSLEEISHFLKTLIFYSKNPFFSPSLYLKFRNSLLARSKIKIIRNGFNKDEVSLMIRYFHIFLTFTDLEMVNHLAEKLLLLDEEQLDYRRSIFILRYLKVIKHDKFSRFKINKKLRLPASVIDLIDKCNSRIYQELSSNLTEENAWTYLIKLHNWQDHKEFDFKNFYDPRILEIVAPVLISTEKISAKFYIPNLIKNFSRFKIFDERLLKYVYELIYDRTYKPKLLFDAIHANFLELRLPFVDYNVLAKFIFEYTKKFEKPTFKRFIDLKILSELILFDIRDEDILDYFNKITNTLEREHYQAMDFHQFKKISLAKAYLSMFVELESSLKNKLELKLENSLENLKMLKKIPSVNFSYYRTDPKIQRSAYLSNGVYIDSFSIYDRSIQDLVPISESMINNYLYRIDKIPISPDQELLVFVISLKSKGNCKEYELNYNYQLKRVLKRLKIKSIEVYGDEFLPLSQEDGIYYFIKKAKENFNKEDK